MQSNDVRPLRLGILSTANIARHFVAALAGSDRVTVEAVASRNAAKAQHFADSNGIPRAIASYEALLADPAIEAIYNPLPNTLHAEWTIRALEAGKHVLCEKPIAVSAEQARSMFATAERTGLCLAEAFPYRSQPQTLRLAELVASGEIGRPRIIQASFGFPVANPANIRLDPALGGGALLDAGSYPVSLVRMVAGTLPTRVTASARWTERGVDQALAATMEFADGMLAQIACSFGTGVYRRATIAFEDGVVLTDFLNHLTPDAPGQFDLYRGGWDARHEALRFPPLSGFLAEAESFADMVRHGPQAWTVIRADESIDVMRMLDALLESARDGVACNL